MTNTWRRAHVSGVVGLVHPESHLVDANAGILRAATYGRLRRHWQFVNEAKLFPDPGNRVEFGVHIYGAAQEVRFLQAVNLLLPATVDRSLEHDGSGDLPGIQYPDGGWDLRPHAKRLVTVDSTVLAEWVRLFDEPGTSPLRSRLVRPLTQADLAALSVFARQPRRLGQMDREWTSGFHEKGAKDDGTFEWRTAVPADLSDCVVQGPHIQNATPFGQQPRENCQNHRDWEALDLEKLPDDFIPRTNYQRLVTPAEFVKRQTTWKGEPYTNRYREAHREFVNPGLERTIKSTLLPPLPPHLYTLCSMVLENNRSTVLLSAYLSSLPADYIIKVFGVAHLTQSVTDALPVPALSPAIDRLLLLRALRLNCLTRAYADLWAELYDADWPFDAFEAAASIVPLGAIGSSWTSATPLRMDLDRWLAFCEIDALVALLLGLPEEQLLQMYRSQFAVLRKYEYVTVFDANGRQISSEHHNRGFKQAQWEAELKLAPAKRGEGRVGMWDRVQAYLAGDGDVDLGPFVPPFAPADREAAMSKAYRSFEKRLAEA